MLMLDHAIGKGTCLVIESIRNNGDTLSVTGLGDIGSNFSTHEISEGFRTVFVLSGLKESLKILG